MKEPGADNRYYSDGRSRVPLLPTMQDPAGGLCSKQKGITLYPETIITGGIAEKP
jgi:hypothetical protein